MIQQQTITTPPEIQYLENLSGLLDNRFRIPGTNIRFGLDAIIGLVPYGGDLVTFSFSGLMVLAMVKHGASGMVVVKMLWNVLLDSIVGSVPLLGDIFDFQFKANRRNFNLLKEHYEEGRHRGSAWPVILAVLLVLLLMLVGIIMVMWEVLKWVLG